MGSLDEGGQIMKLPPDHPIYNPNGFVIETPMCFELEQCLTQWVRLGRTGGVVLGDSRTGKSTAVELVGKRLKTRSEEVIPACFISLCDRDVKTITAVYRNIWFAVNGTYKTKNTSDQMCYDLVHCFADMSFANNARQVALFVDEMQYLTIDQFAPFVELGNKLRLLGTNLSVIFIGNWAECELMLQKITTRQELEMLRGRFFKDSFAFKSITTLKDVDACLSKLDAYKYPADTKYS